jgi:hypothetical protein
VCGATFLAAGPSPTQIPGDCRTTTCDGQGNVLYVTDDGDAPPGDDNNCIVGSCVAGAPWLSNAAVGTACNQGGGTVCDAGGACVQCLSDADCAGTCTGGVCGGPFCTDAMKDWDETDVDCGGPSCPPCGLGKVCAAGADCGSGICSGSVCATSVSICPSPPTGGPTTSWADCSAGVDPTHSGGELVWAEGTWLTDLISSGCGMFSNPSTPVLSDFSLGPTGDVALSMNCDATFSTHLAAHRFNGSGASGLGVELSTQEGSNSFWASTTFDRYNNLVGHLGMEHTWYEERLQATGGSTGSFGWSYISNGAQSPPFGQWDSDALGNAFLVLTLDHAITIGSVALPGPVSPLAQRTHLVRRSATGASYLADFSGAFVADQTGGVYHTGPLGTDDGCGPVNSAAPGFSFARRDASWACVHARALPANAQFVVDAAGGAVLSSSSSSAVDLGCGALAAAPGGSTFVTRIDASGACVSGTALAAPYLQVLLAPGGNVVMSGFVGAGAVDLGGGPLAPLGGQDFVIGELDAAGHHLWSRRLGGPGITFASPKVSTSAAGDVYVLTGWNGTADLGGGGVTVATGELAVGSFSPSGAYRWSRGFHIAGKYLAGLDGCGALVVASTDPAFDPGCGQVVSTPWPLIGPVGWGYSLHVALARFAP